MRIHVRFLRETEEIQEALQKDGWQLEWERDDFLTAQHPLVQDETAARNRLLFGYSPLAKRWHSCCACAESSGLGAGNR